jgi:hypothetical protein
MKVIINREELESLYDLFPSKESLLQALEDRGYVLLGETDKDHVGVFNRVFTMVRRRAYIQGVKPYKPGTPAWNTLSSIADEAWIFSKEYEMDMRVGFVKFLEIAKDQGWLGLRELAMNKFKISELYSLEVALMQDPNAQLTEQIFRVFSGEIANRFGIFKEYSEPDQYIHFVKASEYCLKLNLQAAEFVEKILEAWAWTGDPITPKKLYSKATQDMLEARDGYMIKGNKPVTKKVKIKKGFERWE